jgi:hypothetical protein
VRLALRLIVEEALEGEVSDALGRERYERGEDGKPAIATVTAPFDIARVQIERFHLKRVAGRPNSSQAKSYG